MVIETKKGYYEVKKNVREALDIEMFNECYIEEWYDQFEYIVGDIADQKLRLKGFSKNPNDKDFYHTIPDYIIESCNYMPPYFILQRITKEEYESRKNEPISPEITAGEERMFKLEKKPFDKESLVLNKTVKQTPMIRIDTYKMNEVKTFPLPDDLAMEIAREKAMEQRGHSQKRKNSFRDNNQKQNNKFANNNFKYKENV